MFNCRTFLFSLSQKHSLRTSQPNCRVLYHLGIYRDHKTGQNSMQLTNEANTIHPRVKLQRICLSKHSITTAAANFLTKEAGLNGVIHTTTKWGMIPRSQVAADSTIEYWTACLIARRLYSLRAVATHIGSRLIGCGNYRRHLNREMCRWRTFQTLSCLDDPHQRLTASRVERRMVRRGKQLRNHVWAVWFWMSRA